VVRRGNGRRATSWLTYVNPASSAVVWTRAACFRTYPALLWHLTLAMAALAAVAVTAARARTISSLSPAPTSPNTPPPADPGLIPLTVAEAKRLINLLTAPGTASNTTYAGTYGADATKPAPAGSTTEHDSTADV
jgi:hypothetical protein